MGSGFEAGRFGYSVWVLGFRASKGVGNYMEANWIHSSLPCYLEGRGDLVGRLMMVTAGVIVWLIRVLSTLT